MDKQRVLNYATSYGFDKVEDTGKKWKGYEVWNPDYSDGKIRFTGYPHFILVKGENIRMYVDDKLEIMDLLHPTEGKNDMEWKEPDEDEDIAPEDIYNS